MTHMERALDAREHQLAPSEAQDTCCKTRADAKRERGVTLITVHHAPLCNYFCLGDHERPKHHKTMLESTTVSVGLSVGLSYFAFFAFLIYLKVDKCRSKYLWNNRQF